MASGRCLRASRPVQVQATHGKHRHVAEEALFRTQVPLCTLCTQKLRRERAPARAVLRASILSREHPALAYRYHDDDGGGATSVLHAPPHSRSASSIRGLTPSSPHIDTPRDSRHADGVLPPQPRQRCPVFVMMPLDTVHVRPGDDGPVSEVQSHEALVLALHKIKDAKVQGVMVDVWWGISERAGPREYDFAGYRKLFAAVRDAGLELQAVMSFHAAGTNVGDTCNIQLPPWVLREGAANPDIFYTDAAGFRNRECLSTGCLHEPVLAGRTPLQAYVDFVEAFATEFGDIVGDVITEITVGCGPAGELRYPAYPEGDGRWRFPGVGEFQCYDAYMLRALRAAADAVGRPAWGERGPGDAGTYNSRFWETHFFRDGGGWHTDYGHFFLSWYSSMLVAHADAVLGGVRERLAATCSGVALQSVQAAADDRCGVATTYTFAQRSECVALGLKLAGVHWCVKSFGHAAELTAGYYNTAYRNGYRDVMAVLARHGAHASFTCVEMRDSEHPPEGACGPEALLNKVIETAAEYGVRLTGENALQRYDRYAFDRMYEGAMGSSAAKGSLAQLTFLRMGNLFLDNWDAFHAFMAKMAPDEDA